MRRRYELLMKNRSISSFKRKAARAFMKKLGLDALIIEDPTDLFFWTDLHLSMGTLLITKRSVQLFVDGRYLQLCHERSPIRTYAHTKFLLPNKSVGFDATRTCYARYLKLKKKGAKNLKGIDNLGQQLRSVKAPDEITRIKNACSIATAAMGHIRKRLKPGVTEKQIAEAVELFFKKNGATPSFSPIIAFGTSSAMPHSQPTERKLKKNDLALVDIGCKLNGYCSDMTRAFFIGAKKSKHKAIYKSVKAALDSALEIAKAGVLPKELDRAARKAIESAGFEPYPHSLGHGVGVEIHEMPRIADTVKEPLQEAAVVTIEPGVYIEGVGGVRLENQILIEKNGYTNLTPYPFESL